MRYSDSPAIELARLGHSEIPQLALDNANCRDGGGLGPQGPSAARGSRTPHLSDRPYLIRRHVQTVG
jgi:hypothetical protein